MIKMIPCRLGVTIFRGRYRIFRRGLVGWHVDFILTTDKIQSKKLAREGNKLAILGGQGGENADFIKKLLHKQLSDT